MERLEQPDPELKCRHGLPVVVYTSRKQAGRQFYRCPKPIGEEQCGFFAWVDEVHQPQHRGHDLPPTPQSARPGPSSQLPTQPPLSPTPTQSTKRSFSAIEDAGGQLSSPASQKRTRLIEAVLAQSQSTPDLNHEDGGEHHLRDGISQPQTRVPLLAHDSSSLDMTVRYNNSSQGEQVAPRTPRSSQQLSRSPPPSPIALGKFKPWTGQPISSSLPNNHMDAGHSSQETLADEDEELTAQSVAKLVRSLGNIPAYIYKLERKMLAAEKSRDAKAKKITYLENEVESLRAREKELEEVVAALERAIQ